MTTFVVGNNRIQLEHPAEATGASSIKEKRATLTSNTLQLNNSNLKNFSIMTNN